MTTIGIPNQLTHLTKEQIEQYQELGYCTPIDVMSEDEAQTLKQRLEDAERDYPDAINAENRNNTHLIFPFLHEVIIHPTIVGCVEQLLGSNIVLWGTVLFIKEPQSKGYVSWHQDATYMGLEPHDFTTPWLALTPSNPKSGCMSVIPGSHKAPIRSHRDTFEKDNILTRGQRIQDVDETESVDLILRPGQMSIHHPRLIHGSRPNQSSHRRIGIALQSYMSTSVKQVSGDCYVTLIKGNDVPKDYKTSPRPNSTLDPICREWRETVNKNLSKILYQGAAEKRSY